MKVVLMSLLCLFVAVAYSAAADHKYLNTKPETKLLCEAFMQKMVAGKIEEAMNSIEPYLPVPEGEISTVKIQTVKQLGLVEPRFGKPIGYEFIKEEIVKETFLKYIFIEKFEKHAIRWTFIFYKPQEKWILNSFNFDDQVQNLFE